MAKKKIPTFTPPQDEATTSKAPSPKKAQRTPLRKAGPVASAPPAADPRMPPPGTLLKKLDRHGTVRCECAVEADGIRYAGKVYRSLSAAAMAAAKDLGLNNRTQNGFTFWALSKPSRAPGDPLAALDRVWERYHGNVAALVKGGITDENRSKVIAAIAKHAQVIESLRTKVA